MIELAAGPTALDRLETALKRLVSKHGFTRVSPEQAETFAPPGLAVLLLTEDPQRNPEVLDACVILPEALGVGDGPTRWVAGPECAPLLQQRFGVARPPAVVCLRDGAYVGTLAGIRDWAAYQSEMAALLAGPNQPRPIGIPVRAAHGVEGCA